MTCQSTTIAKSHPTDDGKFRTCEFEENHCGPHKTTYCGQSYYWEDCSLVSGVEKLAKDFTELKELAGFILATLQVNFLRGTITTNPSSSKEELQKLLDSWSETFQKICPPISSKQMAAITADALSDWDETP